MSGYTNRRTRYQDLQRRVHFVSSGSLDGYGPYSPVPVPKPVGRPPVAPAVTPPPYRMPPHPLPPLPPLPGAVTDLPPSSPAYHTHSNKFPIEREVVLTSSDKNNKIPILSEYNKRPRSVVPEGPVSQVAWSADSHQAYNHDLIVQAGAAASGSYVSFNSPQHRHSVDGLGLDLERTEHRHSVDLERAVPRDHDKTKITKTYYTIKDMISNKFSKSKENVDETKQMNNQGVDALTTPLHGVSLAGRPQGRPTPPLPVLRTPHYPAGAPQHTPGTPQHPNFSPTSELLSPVLPSTPLSAQQQERRMHQQRTEGVYATARAFVVQARPPAQRRQVRSSGPPTELSHSSPNLTANLESNGVYMSKTPAKYPAAPGRGESETDDDGGFKRAPPPPPENRPPPPSEELPPLPPEPQVEPSSHPPHISEKISSATSSDYEKTRGSSLGDSGRGSAAYSSGRTGSADPQHNGVVGAQERLQNQNQRAGKEWVDMVESELRHILEPKLASGGGCSSTLSDSVSSLTPPLPPLSPGGSSPTPTPRHMRYNNSSSLPHGMRPDYEKDERKIYGTAKSQRSNNGGRRDWSRNGKMPEKSRGANISRAKIPPGLLSVDTDLGSTTTGPLDSVLDSRLSIHSSDEDMSTTIDANDAMAIRRQLHGLENMYSEVLKLLGVKKQGARGYGPGAAGPADGRPKRRYGSMSSLPSSVSSRPVRDKRREDRKKVRDIKGINKRFQRLESHVVTLARSVAHLSSEMRTQHLMIQEMDNIRSELAALRAETSGAGRSISVPRALNSMLSSPPGDTRDGQALTNPSRVKKLTKFFGDEPPLLRIFLKRLGYEKYAAAFESEKIGMVELPYLTEERLQKMGIPMGPRLRILQEAQISFCRDSVYVV